MYDSSRTKILVNVEGLSDKNTDEHYFVATGMWKSLPEFCTAFRAK
jgi:hypothetical protein